MENSREVATNILIEIFDNKAYSNIILSNRLNSSNLIEKDKGLVTEIVYGTIKYKYSIDVILSSFIKKNIKNLNSFILNLLRISIYQLKYLDKLPDFAVVNEAVDLAKKRTSIPQSKFVNGVLRNYLRNKDKDYSSKDKIKNICFEYSFDEWMVRLFLSQYGEDKTIAILKGLNEKPNITVRVNNLKSNYDDVFEELKNKNYNVDEGYICPEAIRIIKGKNIEQNPLFISGYVTVQDESAMLVAPSMEIKEDLKVMDLCSAPGGKTTHISELMNNRGKVWAFDIHKNKLSLIKENTKRLGITNIELNVLDATKLEERFIDFAERVLIDVPCSGFGIIRKKPEIKWSKGLKDVNNIVNIQRQIMKNAALYLKKDGILLYSTCTLNKNENEKNIEWFIKEFPEFTVESLNFGNLQNIIYDKRGFVTILPNSFMDGFFIAKLKKNW